LAGRRRRKRRRRRRSGTGAETLHSSRSHRIAANSALETIISCTLLVYIVAEFVDRIEGGTIFATATEER
jgi:hypothetical protein